MTLRGLMSKTQTNLHTGHKRFGPTQRHRLRPQLNPKAQRKACGKTNISFIEQRNTQHTTHNTQHTQPTHATHNTHATPQRWRCCLATQSRARGADVRFTQARATRGQTPEGAVSRRTTRDPEYGHIRQLATEKTVSTIAINMPQRSSFV